MREPPRTDLLITDLEVGGAEHQLLILAQQLQQRGWPIRVLSMVPPGRLEDAFRDARLVVTHLGMRYGRPDPRGATRLIAELRRGRTQVLLSFLYHANILGRIAGRMARVPRIVSSMRNEHFGSPRRDAVLRRTDRWGHLNTTNSELTAAEIRRRNIVPHRGIRVIPNAIDTDRFITAAGAGEELRAELGLTPDAFCGLLSRALSHRRICPPRSGPFRHSTLGTCTS
jgi:hypothetical protein